ncbi:WD repeat and FYVE domain-containing protein 3 [Homalodisca vitripennis]|nr:WD repeat and FYVE domain-containing protein 3 [Homalodisca vitripennis]KAG8294826.1 WD repeat and FYVE domain-containing protein 3 [Homalodisca vitripennis]
MFCVCAGLPALVAEEKVVFGLNAKAVTHLTLAKIRKVYSRVDNKSIAKQEMEFDREIKNQFSVSLQVTKSKQALITTTELIGNLPGVDTANHIYQTPQVNSISNNDNDQILVEAQIYQPDSYSPPKLLKKSSRLTQGA